MSDKKNDPVDRIQEGSIHASFFQNRGKHGDYISTSIKRVYPDHKNGGFGETSSYSGGELLQLSRLAARAYERERELTEQLRQMQRNQDVSQRSRTRGTGANIEAAREAMDRASNGMDRSHSDDYGHER